MKKLIGRVIGSRSKMAKKHEANGKIYCGYSSWASYKRRQRVKAEKAMKNGCGADK